MEKPERVTPETQLCQEEQGEQVKPSPALSLSMPHGSGSEVEVGRAEGGCVRADLEALTESLYGGLLHEHRGGAGGSIATSRYRAAFWAGLSSLAEYLYSVLEALGSIPGVLNKKKPYLMLPT